MSRSSSASQHWYIQPWDVYLSAEQASHIQQLAEALQQAMASQPQAWLVFDGWKDNVAAAWLQAQYPAWAAERQTLPDPALRDLEDMAPCLLPLHRWPQHEADPAKRQNVLHDLLGLMWLDAQRRLVRQNLCGVVLSSAQVDDVLEHWLLLGQQITSDGQERLAFRHHDPRVLQRVWPSLSAQQRQTLLGPVHSVWQLSAPWGAWSPADMQKGGDHYLPGPERLCGQAPDWHVARATATGPSLPVHKLLNTEQLQRLRCMAAAQQCWQLMALSQVPTAQQPGEQAMHRMCQQMQAWRTSHAVPWSNELASQWLWCTWSGPHSQTPQSASNAQAIDWTAAPWKERAGQLAQCLREEPGIGFRVHFNDLLAQVRIPSDAPAQMHA